MDMQAYIDEFKKVIKDNNLNFDTIKDKKVKGSFVFSDRGEYKFPTIIVKHPPEKGEYIASVKSIGTEIKKVKIMRVTDVKVTKIKEMKLDPNDPFLYMSYPSTFSEARKNYYYWIELYLDGLKCAKKKIVEDLPERKLGESSAKRLIKAIYEKAYLSIVPQFEMKVAFDKKFDKYPHEAKGAWVKIKGKEQEIPFRWNGEGIKKMDLIIKMASEKGDPLEIETMEVFVVGGIQRELETILDWQNDKWVKEPEECDLIKKLVGEALFNHILDLLRTSGK
jgi:hypothetical protein